MIRNLLMLSFIFIATIPAICQDKTVVLDEVVVNSLPFEKYISGSKIEKSDSLPLQLLAQKTLSDYLMQNSTVYLKEYGNAMMSTVSFRGTGASHTGVFWHGINLNSLTLGHSDFNSIPLFLFDQVAIQYGGAGSVHGSDAIGGSIHLSSMPNWTEGYRLQIRQDLGSFGNFFTGARFETGNGKWESKTAIFKKSLRNNFTYKIKDRLGETHKIEQENAGVHNYGMLQQFHRKINSNGHFAVKGWYGQNYHQIQPQMVSTPGQPQPGDEITDQNLRLIASYDHYFEKGILLASAGYVWDYQLFNQSDLIETRRLIVDVQNEWTLSEKLMLKAGANFMRIIPNVWSYADGITEYRSDPFLSLSYTISDSWLVNANVRKTYVPFTKTPVAPSISTSYKLQLQQAVLTVRAQAERSYRVPTFNDRYWGNQGRKDLESENGYSVELGQNLQIAAGKNLWTVDLAAYRMNIDNWIAWRPAGNLWRPYNLKEVQASGVEMTGKFTGKTGISTIDLGLMYAYNRTRLLRGISENDPAVGYQLPYTPEHRLVLFGNFTFNAYRFSINNSFTGSRYGMDVIYNKLDPFLRTDMTASRNVRLGKNMISLEAQMLNVFNVDYQNVDRFAMPGRNYLFSINFFFNN